MNPEQIRQIMPNASQRAEVFAAPLTVAMVEFAIDRPQRIAAFIANVAHESMQLHALEENLNYSAQALNRIWPQKFPPHIAAVYARDQERIANRAYALREGNGDEASGDGWRYRGAGLIQLTHYNNHAACGKHFNIPPKGVGIWLRTPEGAARSAAWYWQSRALNAYADAGDFDAVCDLINKGRKTAADGDALGYAERMAFYRIALEILA
jgi:putative chitinase